MEEPHYSALQVNRDGSAGEGTESKLKGDFHDGVSISHLLRDCAQPAEDTSNDRYHTSILTTIHKSSLGPLEDSSGKSQYAPEKQRLIDKRQQAQTHRQLMLQRESMQEEPGDEPVWEGPLFTPRAEGSAALNFFKRPDHVPALDLSKLPPPEVSSEKLHHRSRVMDTERTNILKKQLHEAKEKELADHDDKHSEYLSELKNLFPF